LAGCRWPAAAALVVWWIDHLRCDEAKLQRGAHEDKPAPGIEAHGE
jgi:hypothetical protein